MDIQKRSHAGVMTIAVLQLTFGIIGILCDLFALSGVSEMWAKQQPAAPGQLSQAEIQDIIKKEIPNQKIFQVVNTSIDLLLSVLMIVSGIALLRMKAWGRTVAIVYAVGSILYHIYTVIFSIVFVLPAMDAVFTQMEARMGKGVPGLGGIMKASMIGGLVLGSLLTLYPIAVLIVMNLRSAKLALSDVPVEPFDLPQDFDDRRERQSGDQYRQAPDDRIGPQ